MFIYYNYYFFYQLLYILTNINIYYIYIQRGTNSMANFAKKKICIFLCLSAKHASFNTNLKNRLIAIIFVKDDF
jgi:hypothetical protein